jgi:predicted ATPase
MCLVTSHRPSAGELVIIRTVYIRFFRSFNHDHLRKSRPGATPRGPWELLGEDRLWYPFTEIGLEDGITTVVGANEAGKSQLLAAIKCALTGEEIHEHDFCRYSQFFSVDRAMSSPDFGLLLGSLDDADRAALAESCGIDVAAGVDRFRLFRFSGRKPTVYLEGADGVHHEHEVQDEESLIGVLPRVFEIDSTIPLPDSVPLSYLIDGELTTLADRAGRRKAFQMLEDNAPQWFATAEATAAAAAQIHQALSPLNTVNAKQEAEFALARDLLVKVAGVDLSAFRQLKDALVRGAEGQANGIVSRINHELAKQLNFQKYWSQDSDFALVARTGAMDLVFTIRDRTGTDYSFEERSGGLRFFLSYFVQALVHMSEREDGAEILLMDEPDAHLSSSGQQDLLRIFQDYARPPDGGQESQVAYVTHSPFLIDKNHSERIRVLDKGAGEEGTRVVANAARNHYEPLRSAFGSFVGETTFISNCNLLLEGMSDQIVLAGMSTLLQQSPTPRTQYLDLNQITLVPAGSASHVPYMAYLALGRDQESPAVIALLDSDKAGDDARDALNRGPNGKPIMRPDLVLQIGQLAGRVVSDRAGGPTEIEDLIPAGIVLAGAKRYVQDFLGASSHEAINGVTAADIDLGHGKGLHGAVEALLKDRLDGDFHLDKFGLARSVIDVLNNHEADPVDGLPVLLANFRELFSELNKRQRDADRDVLTKRVRARLKRERKSFFMDHPERATREQGGLLLEEFDRQVDDSTHADEWRSDLHRVRRDFLLDRDLLEPITDYEAFRTAIDGLVDFEQHRTMAKPAAEADPVGVADDVPGKPEPGAADPRGGAAKGRRRSASGTARRV